MQYQQAAADFEAIGADRSSPWRSSALYLAARSMVREATVQPGSITPPAANPAYTAPGTPGRKPSFESIWLAKAEAQVDAVMADKSDAGWWKAARELRGFIEIRLHPKQRLLRLASKLSQRDATFRQDSIDLAYIANGSGLSWRQMAQQPLLLWVDLLPGGAGFNEWAYDTALAQWRKTQALPWLVAALHKSDRPGLAGKSELLAAAAAVPPTSPAFATLQYQMLRLDRLGGPAGAARAQASIAKLPLAGMAIPTRNRFLALKLATAPTLDVALAAAPRTLNDGSFTGFDADALTLFNQALPLDLLAQAAQSPALPPKLHDAVLTAAWTRAVLLNDDVTTRVLAPQLAVAHPKLAPDLKSITETGLFQYQERQFDEAWLLLHFPGMSPYVGEAGRTDWRGHPLGLDQLDPDGGDNWWDSYVPGDTGRGYIPPPFVTATMVYQWMAQSQRLKALGPAPNVLCGWVLDWVRSAPNDPRDAEALALAVAATAHAHGNAQTAGLSKQCYDLLHAKYPDTTWSQKTTQWYKGYCGRYEVCQE